MKILRFLPVFSVLAVAIAGLLLMAPTHADSTAITFEPALYTTGSPNGQDGWVALGSAGMGCALYDHQIVNNSSFPAPASFGTQSGNQNIGVYNNVWNGHNGIIYDMLCNINIGYQGQ